MIPLRSLLIVVLATPLVAQAPRIAPTRSVLFRAAADQSVTDTTGHRYRPSVIKAGGIGAGVGLLVGVAIGAYQASGHPCSCDDPGLEPFVGGFLGTVGGFVVGASIADERRQQDRHRAEPPPPIILRTENGTPVTGDSTRLVGHDRHGVRGGIAGALMGGAIGYAVPHAVYSLQHAGGYTAGGGGSARGPSPLSVGLSTITGAVSGYLIAAMLSRH